MAQRKPDARPPAEAERLFIDNRRLAFWFLARARRAGRVRPGEWDECLSFIDEGLWRACQLYDGRGSLATYATRWMWNRLQHFAEQRDADALARNMRPLLPLDAGPEPACYEGPDAGLEAAERRQRGSALLASLTPEDRGVVLDRLHRVPMRVTAARLDVTHQAVAQRYARILRTLKARHA